MLTMNTRVAAVKSAPKSFLATMDLFKKLPAQALAEIEKHMVEKKFAKHESIFLEGDAADFVWFVKEGHVKAMNHTPSGRCQTLCMSGAGAMFGSCCSFGGGQYPCNSVAETEVTAVRLPMSDFMALLSKYAEVGSALVATLSKHLRRSKDMQMFEQEPVEKRILHILVNLVEEFGSTIPLTRREIAEMAGTTVETCIRTFARLEDEGVVSSTRGKILVKDTQVLSDRIEEL